MTATPKQPKETPEQEIARLLDELSEAEPTIMIENARAFVQLSDDYQKIRDILHGWAYPPIRFDRELPAHVLAFRDDHLAILQRIADFACAAQLHAFTEGTEKSQAFMEKAKASARARIDELEKELAEVSPPVAAPTFKVGDRVRYVGPEELYGVAVGTPGKITSLPNSPTGQTAVVMFDARGPFILLCFEELELIPSPLSGDFRSEADDARLVRVGKLVWRRLERVGPNGNEDAIGSISNNFIKTSFEGVQQGWKYVFEEGACSRLNKEARLTLRTAEATLTDAERAKVEAAP